MRYELAKTALCYIERLKSDVQSGISLEVRDTSLSLGHEKLGSEGKDFCSVFFRFDKACTVSN